MRTPVTFPLPRRDMGGRAFATAVHGYSSALRGCRRRRLRAVLCRSQPTASAADGAIFPSRPTLPYRVRRDFYLLPALLPGGWVTALHSACLPLYVRRCGRAILGITYILLINIYV